MKELIMIPDAGVLCVCMQNIHICTINSPIPEIESTEDGVWIGTLRLIGKWAISVKTYEEFNKIYVQQ